MIDKFLLQTELGHDEVEHAVFPTFRDPEAFLLQKEQRQPLRGPMFQHAA